MTASRITSKRSTTVLGHGDHRVCHMQYVKALSELAARRSQVRALRKMVRQLGGTVPR